MTEGVTRISKLLTLRRSNTMTEPIDWSSKSRRPRTNLSGNLTKLKNYVPKLRRFR